MRIVCLSFETKESIRFGVLCLLVSLLNASLLFAGIQVHPNQGGSTWQVASEGDVVAYNRGRDLILGKLLPDGSVTDVSRISFNEAIHDIAIDGAMMLVAADEAYLLKIDDLNNPVHLGKLGVPRKADYGITCVGLKGNVAFVSREQDVWHLFDIEESLETPEWSNPFPPAEEGIFLERKSGLYLIVSAPNLWEVSIFNIENLANPVNAWERHNIGLPAVHGNVMAVVGLGAVIDNYDIADPAAPVLKKSFEFSGIIHSMLMDEQYLYVSAGIAGIEVIEINDPTQATTVAQVETKAYVHELAKSGDVLLAADDTCLSTFRLDGVNEFPILGSLELGDGNVAAIDLEDNMAYLGMEDSIHVVDVTDPLNMSVVDSFPLDAPGHKLRDLQVMEGRILPEFVGGGPGRLYFNVDDEFVYKELGGVYFHGVMSSPDTTFQTTNNTLDFISWGADPFVQNSATSIVGVGQSVVMGNGVVYLAGYAGSYGAISQYMADTGVAAGFTSVMNPVTCLAFAESHLFARSIGSVRSWDASDPVAPRLLDTIPLSSGYDSRLAHTGGILADASHLVTHFLEARNPEDVRLVSSLRGFGGVDVAAGDGRFFLARAEEPKLVVFGIPPVIHTQSTPWHNAETMITPQECIVTGSTGFLRSYAHTYQEFEITTAGIRTLRTGPTSDGLAVDIGSSSNLAAEDNLLCVQASRGIALYDRSNGGPEFIGYLRPLPNTFILDVAVLNGFVYTLERPTTSSLDYWVNAYDISHPLMPINVGKFDFEVNSSPVYLIESDGRLFVSYPDRVGVLHTTATGVPQFQGWLDWPDNSPRDVVADGNLLFVSDDPDNGGLTIIDLAGLPGTTIIGHGTGSRVGMEIDIDPISRILLGGNPTVYGDELVAYDVSDPANPIAIGLPFVNGRFGNTPGTVRDVVALGDSRFLVCDEDAGTLIVDFDDETAGTGVVVR